MKYYTLDRILKENADYNIIYGERSNGKTTAVLGYGLKRYIESGYKDQLAIIRRWEEDYKGKNGSQMFEGITDLGWVTDWTNGEYNAIYYYSQRWYLCFIDKDAKRTKTMETPFALGFSISSQEHYKSTSYPDVKIILFDEFITRTYYLPEEFVSYQNLLSTLIRLKDDVKIFMCGNTINRYCPYFSEMGLTNIRKQQPDTVDIYTYGDSSLRVAVEYSVGDKKTKKGSNKYFAFNNPKLNMIKNGAWELDIYPHIPIKYLPKEVKYTYFILFNDELLQCEIIYSKELKTSFTYIHRKTTPIQEDNRGIVYTTEPSAKRNYRRKITLPYDDLGGVIYDYFRTDKVFYQDNEVGEVVRNYIIWCTKEGI